MILDCNEVRDILKGDTLAVFVRTRPLDDSLHTVQVAVGKKAACVVRVLESWPHAHRPGFVASVELTAREIPVRYLRQGGGYTTVPGEACKDPETGAKEWAPPADWIDQGAEQRRKQLAQQKRFDAVDNLDLGEQIDSLLAEARAMGEDRFAGHVRRLEAARDALERRLVRERAGQRRAA